VCCQQGRAGVSPADTCSPSTMTSVQTLPAIHRQCQALTTEVLPQDLLPLGHSKRLRQGPGDCKTAENSKMQACEIVVI
jgi:hypothetical protein